jgi:putative endonuclease
MPAGWIYIMTNRPNGTLYLGVTNNLARRVGEHQAGCGSTFTSRYKLHRLVYAEPHENMASAIQRETSLKRWPRAWKVRLIVAGNPNWDDFSVGLM